MIEVIKSLANLQGVERVSVHFDARSNLHVQVRPSLDSISELRDLSRAIFLLLPGYDVEYSLDAHVFDVYPR